jgi:protein ImuB
VPLAFVEKVKGAMRIKAVDRTARALGLGPGLALADARARVPDLVVQDHDAGADANWLDRLAARCARFTPMVAVDPPDGLLLDVTGCAHLFGDEENLTGEIAAWLGKLGMTMRSARAATAEAAHALARFHNGAVSDERMAVRHLPVAALELDSESDLGLRRAGLKTVGMVADRPRAAIAARFGAASVLALERLLGEAEGPLNPRYSEPPLILERRFAEPIANTEYALRTVRALMEEAAGHLTKRDLGGCAFEAAFFRSDGLVQRLQIETGLPTRDIDAVIRLFEERIEALNDPLDPGFGFDSVRLSVPKTEALRPSQTHLEGEKTGDSDIAALVDRLSVRLGRHRVQRLQPYDTHIPEKDQIALPSVEASGNTVWSIPGAGEPPARPLHLFDPPERITVLAEVPDGPPHRFNWRRKSYDITRYEGPERIASEWWQSKRDPLGEGRLTRDYYRIEDGSGHRYWVFRHGLYGCEKSEPDWYLHGLFA